MNRLHEDSESFLDREILGTNLAKASLYIVAFEMLKSVITEHGRSFYSVGLDENGQQAPSRDKSEVYAALRESPALSDDDVVSFDRVKKLRNTLAHELPNKLITGLPAELAERFSELLELLDKIERLRSVNAEVPTDPQFDGQEIDEAGILPGSIIALRVIAGAVLGTGEPAKFYIEELLKGANAKRAQNSDKTKR